jgi:hypothetical protein
MKDGNEGENSPISYVWLLSNSSESSKPEKISLNAKRGLNA